MVMLPGGRAAPGGEQYGRGFERQYVRLVKTPPNPTAG